MEEIFGPLLDEHLTDGKHEMVLDNCILLDAFVYSYDLAYYEKFHGKNAFLVHFLDENFEGRYEAIYRNFRGVFRCHWADVFNRKYVMRLPIGYCSGMSRAGRRIEAATQRRYLWSFVGQAAKSSRPDMAKALSGVEPHFLFATDDVSGFVFLQPAGGGSRRLPASEASEILFQSVFSPCPMGNVQVESFRVYEALEAGSIPIVEKRWTLDYFRMLWGEHPIPTVRSWAEGRDLIQRMAADPDGLDALQERCLTWWADYKRGYRDEAAEFIRKRSADSVPVREPIMTPKYSLPGWRVIELLRHHDANALARRIHRQVSRVLRKGTLRVAHRPGVKLD
jgi:hypothetical protein